MCLLNNYWTIKHPQRTVFQQQVKYEIKEETLSYLMQLQQSLLNVNQKIKAQRKGFLEMMNNMLKYYKVCTKSSQLIEKHLDHFSQRNQISQKYDWVTFIQERRFQAYLSNNQPQPSKRSGNIILISKQQLGGPKVVERRGRKRKIKDSDSNFQQNQRKKQNQTSNMQSVNQLGDDQLGYIDLQ